MWHGRRLDERLGPPFSDEQRRDAVADLVYLAWLKVVEANAVDTQEYRLLNDSETHPVRKFLLPAGSSKRSACLLLAGTPK
jgi:hypothetical protein